MAARKPPRGGNDCEQVKHPMSAGFDDFLLKEYERISEAHFSAWNSISQFIRYYFVVASVPPAIAALLSRPMEGKEIIAYLQLHPFLASGPLFAISVVGFLLSLYVMGLHHDAILYARTVNGVRSYFAAKDPDAKKYLVLPVDTSTPHFKGLRPMFLAIAFAIVNGGYAMAAVWLHHQLREWPLTWWVWITPVGMVSAYFLVYQSLGKREERKWAR